MRSLSCPVSVVAAVVLVCLAGAARAQVYGGGRCPDYQTSDRFTVDRVSHMIKSDGMVPYLSSGTLAERYQSCQYLKLLESTTFTYSYRDALNTQRTISGRYEVMPSAYNTPGYLELDMGQMGLLGSDVTGRVRLYPVLLDNTREVFVSCTNFGFFHAEYAYTFLAPNALTSGDIGEVKRDLVKLGLPLADSMTANDQTCFETPSGESFRRPSGTVRENPSDNRRVYDVTMSTINNPINFDITVNSPPNRNSVTSGGVNPSGVRNPLWDDVKAKA